MFNKIKLFIYPFYKYYKFHIKRKVLSLSNRLVIEEDKIINKNQVIVNGKKINKMSIVSHISKWAKKSFVFSNGMVNLPNEVDMPISNIDDEMTQLKNFKTTKLGALEYLITCVLAIGIKIGREIERYEQKGKE